MAVCLHFELMQGGEPNS